ncbi:MAG: D-hexose-6-phosphate mutarotase [Verrucomicrobiota bacterium]
MQINLIPEKLRRLEIPGRVEIINGRGGLPLVKITTPWSTAEVYLLGAHVAGFHKNGEPPLLFMSAKSWFENGKPIRGGVPICFPWFGGRDGEPAHGLVRILPWELAETAAATNGAVTVRLRLAKDSLKSEWAALRTELVVTVAETLTMELVATNESTDQTLEIENCLHTYFQVGDIGAVSLTGLQNAPFNDFAAGTAGAGKVENDPVLRIAKETNRVYPDNTATVEIRDEKLKRLIRVEKSNSKSTVVWNPWTTQKLPDDFDPAEYSQMVCVESGNVKQNKISLAQGKATALKVVLSSHVL